MKKFPSIEQYRNVIREVRSRHDFKGKDENGDAIYQHTENYPILKFTGTIKLHGTNAGIVKYSDGRIEYQSRENVLCLDPGEAYQDNAGFMTYMIKQDLSFIFNNFKYQDYIAVYGEWCGKGIQKGVGINELPKMFVIFGIKIDDNWVDIPNWMYDHVNNIYNINEFTTYTIDIDFNNPELSQNKMIEMTLEVETCCPVAKHFGIEGIGEGIVFTCDADKSLKFKSKGEKHSVSKVKKLNSIDVETLSSINELVDAIVTENRLDQGLTYLQENKFEFDAKSTSEFLRWIVSDVLKEESDTIAQNGFDDKKVKHAITNKARMWFFNKLAVTY